MLTRHLLTQSSQTAHVGLYPRYDLFGRGYLNLAQGSDPALADLRLGTTIAGPRITFQGHYTLTQSILIVCQTLMKPTENGASWQIHNTDIFREGFVYMSPLITNNKGWFRNQHFSQQN